MISANLSLDTVWFVFTALNFDQRTLISLKGDTAPKSVSALLPTSERPTERVTGKN